MFIFIVYICTTFIINKCAFGEKNNKNAEYSGLTVAVKQELAKNFHYFIIGLDLVKSANFLQRVSYFREI